MNDIQFAAIIKWFMYSDPWPTDRPEHLVVMSWLNNESKIRGYLDAFDAYFQLYTTVGRRHPHE